MLTYLTSNSRSDIAYALNQGQIFLQSQEQSYSFYQVHLTLS